MTTDFYIEDYGGGPSKTGAQNDAAFILMYAAMANHDRWLVQPGIYVFASTIVLNVSGIIIKGQESVPIANPPSKFVFPIDTRGIRMTTRSRIEDLWLHSSGGTNATDTEGILMESPGYLWLVRVDNFPGYGIRVDAGASRTPSTNANHWEMHSCRCLSNGKSGLYVNGPDGNAGTVISLDSTSNTEWGVFDESFLGNTYIACHTNSNVTGSYKVSGGNNKSILLNCYAEGNQNDAQIEYPSMRIGGLMTTNETFDGTGIAGNSIDVSARTFQFANYIDAANKVEFNMGGGTSGFIWEMIAFANGSSGSSRPYRMQYDTGTTYAELFNVRYNNSSTAVAYSLTSDDTPTFGAGYMYFPRGMLFGTNDDQMQLLNMEIRGSGSSKRYGLAVTLHGVKSFMGWATATPTASGTYAKGDIFWNSAAAVGQPIGWICTTAGTGVGATWTALANA